MKIYLAGPMSGVPELNYPEFNLATKYLRTLGHEVFSPAELNMPGYDDKAVLREAFAKEMDYICRHADMVAFLPGWENSKGANAEWALAKCLGHEMWYLTREEYFYA